MKKFLRRVWYALRLNASIATWVKEEWTVAGDVRATAITMVAASCEP